MLQIKSISLGEKTKLEDLGCYSKNLFTVREAKHLNVSHARHTVASPQLKIFNCQTNHL